MNSIHQLAAMPYLTWYKHRQQDQEHQKSIQTGRHVGAENCEPANLNLIEKICANQLLKTLFYSYVPSDESEQRSEQRARVDRMLITIWSSKQLICHWLATLNTTVGKELWHSCCRSPLLAWLFANMSRARRCQLKCLS